MPLYEKNIIQDEGVTIGTATTFDFTGTGVTASVSGDKATIDVSGSGGGGLSQQQVMAIASLKI